MKKIKSILMIGVTALLLPISSTVIAKETENNPNVYSEDEIIRQPKLLERLIFSLIYQQHDDLEKILNLYKKSHSQDPYLILWAEAKVLMKKREYQKAIKKLETILNNYDSQTIKFDLAILYLLNKQYNQSEKVFNNLLVNANDEQEKKNINDYLKYIEDKKEANSYVNFSFQRDTNITKMSNNFTSEIRPNKQYLNVKDIGLSYNAGISKKIFFDSGLFSELDVDVYGIRYLKEKRYDQLTTKIGNKIGFEDYYNYFFLKPFYTKAFYGGGVSNSETGFHSFYDAIGFDLFKLTSFNDKFKHTIFYENKNEYYTYNRNKDLNGDINLINSSLIFLPFNDLYLSLSGNYRVINREYRWDSYHVQGVGFLIRKLFLDDYLVELNYDKMKTNYKTKSLDSFRVKREDITDSVSLSLSNRSINLFGIYPRISFSYNKNKSNHPYYSYTDKDISLEFRSDF
ncbi:surface lipoprotein assembly modifier [Xenorhabdus innexi]|uniref:NilB n=1 Tax=Xenorhabdus innexi TaxID=290109 RepID=A0A1N6N088_9GAMM|nr:surface lipoprotein assembly modifier [Xenorhabdus innexi]PHM37721.1 hypothetical protein Xinn_00819 [Xenorhabdus innexi]SIP74444.1 NilB [Xenorhabdus innexi]